MCVCISAALLKQINALTGPYQDQPEDEANVQLQRISSWAYVGELCIHGNPSGIDNIVSTRGRAILYKRAHRSKLPTTTRIDSFPALPLLLIDTRQSRSTAIELAKVSALKERYPTLIEATLNSIDELTMLAHSLITSKDFDATSEQDLEHLGIFFRINHGFLVSLGVSIQSLSIFENWLTTLTLGGPSLQVQEAVDVPSPCSNAT
jgi:mevalonate kinase